MGLGSFLDFMRGKWGWALALALLFGLTATRETLQRAKGALAAEEAAHKFTIANYRLAAEKARGDDLKHSIEVKARDDRIAQERQDELEGQLVDARAALARHVDRMRGLAARADTRGLGGADLPAATGAAGDPALGAGLTLVPVGDLDICARNTVIAKGWQDWWARVSAVDR